MQNSHTAIVGLPLIVECCKKYSTLGFDINTARLAELQQKHDSVKSEFFNLAVGDSTILNDLYYAAITENDRSYENSLVHGDFRAGDIRHSQADISKVVSKLGYAPQYSIIDDTAKAMTWYIENVG